MATDDNIRLVRRYFDEIWNQRRREVIAEIFADEFMVHSGEGHYPWKPETVGSSVESWCSAFPDLRYDVLHIGAVDDCVFVNTNYGGTHTGVSEWFQHGPWEPTNRRFVSPEMFVFHVTDERISEFWAIWDAYDVATQLGVQLK